MPEVPSSIDTLLPLEKRMQIFDKLRMRLVELCLWHNFWLAGGRYYLAKPANKCVCFDTKTNKEAVVSWQWVDYALEFDPGNRNQRDFAEGSSFTPLNATVQFLASPLNWKDTELKKIHMDRMSPEDLLSFLSEKSIRLEEIEWEIRAIHEQRFGNFWPTKRAIFGPKQPRTDFEKLHPEYLTLVLNDSRISHNVEEDISFVGLEEWDRYYPDFSRVFPSDIVERHGKEYLEIPCWYQKTGRSKKHLLSRPKWSGKWGKHYLQVGPNKFEVMHLVGHTHAEIKFLNGMYRVDVDEGGNIKSKQERYINLSGSSTFWYDLQTGQKLDHEPA